MSVKQSESTDTEPATESLDLNDSDDIEAEVDSFIDTILDQSADTDTREQVVNFLNAASGTALTRYSIDNQLIIFRQLKTRDAEYADDAKHFCGYNTWQNEHNRHVDEGSEGYSLIAPNMGLKCPDCGNTPSYHTNEWIDCDRAGTSPDSWDINPQDEWSEGVIYFRKATTFAFEQTSPLDDADEDEVFTPMDDDADADAETEQAATEILTKAQAAAESGAFDDLDESIDVAIRSPESVTEMVSGGVSKDGSIQITPAESATSELKTLIHEIAHELNHQSDDTNLATEVEEVEAETVAYAVCRYFGFEVEGSELYLGCWAEHARDAADTTRDDTDNWNDTTPRDVIKNRLSVVQETATEIIETIEA